MAEFRLSIYVLHCGAIVGIHFTCKQCNHAYSVNDQMAGRRVDCRQCNAVMVIPSRSAAAIPPTLQPASGDSDAQIGAFASLEEAMAMESSAAPTKSTADVRPRTTTARQGKPKSKPRRTIERREVGDPSDYPTWQASPYDSIVLLLMKLAAGVVALIAVPFVFFLTLGKLDAAQASASWPSAEMTVDIAKIRTESGHHGIGKKYIPEIAYRFAVNGKAYHGSRISYGNFSPDETMAQATIRQYAVGTKHRVYYDPEVPGECTLIVGESTSNYLALLLAPMLLLLGGGVTWQHSFELRARLATGSLKALPDPRGTQRTSRPILLVLGVALTVGSLLFILVAVKLAGGEIPGGPTPFYVMATVCGAGALACWVAIFRR